MVSTTGSGDSVGHERTVVLASTIIGLIFSHVSYAARLWARKKSGAGLKLEDFMMALAFPFSYIPAACLLYGLSVGLGEHVKNVSKADLRKFNISLFVLQRGNPPCLFCVKTSILLLYVRLFPTRIFKRVALGVWIFTLCWAISAFMSNLFQCTPVSFFWDKTQPGKCLPNALITIGLTNGVLSFVGDLVILALPFPMIWKLQINRRRKAALAGMFLLGGFVCVTSILRFMALLQINIKDITFTQVDPGVWTYIELSIGITCGNLPLLRPLFGKWLSTGNTTPGTYQMSAPTRLGKSTNTSQSTRYEFERDGFTRMDLESVAESGSDIELRPRNQDMKSQAEVETEGSVYQGRGISVKTHVDVTVEPDRNEIEQRIRNLSEKRGPVRIAT